jgi:Leucine-rich repeat (LRR) protein
MGRQPHVTLTVWDKDLITDDFLGLVHVDLADLPLDGTSLWRDLQPRPGKKDKIKGSIRMSFVPGTKSAVSNAGAKSEGVSNQVAGRLKAANESDATELDLTGCNLAEVPDGVLAVPEWTSLDLGFNVFETFPETLTVFKYLAELFLSGNRLTTLPPAIGQLGGSLRSLYLNGNFLTAIPAEISELANLEKLDVANNQIKFLPPEIGNISQLEELRLNGNPIVTLPVELGKLQYLITLDLNGCALNNIPDKCLINPRLLELDLGTNQLTVLPNDFGTLTRLVTLNLADNQLTDLPLSMGKCESMDSCQLERNPIKNERLMEKYQMGTDHLIDFLSKRLFEHEQVAKQRMKQGIDKNRAKAKLSDAAEPDAAPSSSSSGGGGGGRRPKLSDFAKGDGDELNWVSTGLGRARNDEDDDDFDLVTPEQREAIALSKLPPEERTTKKRYAAQASAHQIRQLLVGVKKGVMLSKAVEDCLPWAKLTRDLKGESDAIVDLLGRIEKPQPAPLFPHETKFQQLKKTTLVALKEVEAVNNAVLNTCSTLIAEDRVDIFREFLKRANARLIQDLGDPNAPK